MESLLKNKVAIITGGSSGIGFAIAKLFANEGADIVIGDIDMRRASNTKRVIEKNTKRKVLAIKVDISKRNDVLKMTKNVIKEFSKMDILVNNAGIYINDSVLTMHEEAWDKVIDTNLKGTFLCSQVVAKEMVKRKYGKIINISSCCAVQPTIGGVAYGVSKAGIIQLTREFAYELGEKGVYVNAILPGMTVTNMTKEMLNTKDKRQKWISNNLLKRLGKPIDQANLALFLASNLSDHITGESIVSSAGALIT
ncbi:SDR family NAD(P)-dependent oxidoreductase [Actinomycetota bacterium]